MNSLFCVAVHALVYLNHKACMLSSEELAQNICTNPARVRKAMAYLKKTGWIETKGGKVGGYRLVAKPENINLAEVAETMQIRFVEATWRSGDSDMECYIASGMADLLDGIFADLDELCKHHLQTIHISDLDQQIFADK